MRNVVVVFFWCNWYIFGDVLNLFLAQLNMLFGDCINFVSVDMDSFNEFEVCVPSIHFFIEGIVVKIKNGISSITEIKDWIVENL